MIGLLAKFIKGNVHVNEPSWKHQIFFQFMHFCKQSAIVYIWRYQRDAKVMSFLIPASYEVLL